MRTATSNSCMLSRPSRFVSMARNSSAHLGVAERRLAARTPAALSSANQRVIQLAQMHSKHLVLSESVCVCLCPFVKQTTIRLTSSVVHQIIQQRGNIPQLPTLKIKLAHSHRQSFLDSRSFSQRAFSDNETTQLSQGCSKRFHCNSLTQA